MKVNLTALAGLTLLLISAEDSFSDTLLSTRRTGSAQRFELWLSTAPDTSLMVQRSPDLSNWNLWQTFWSGSGLIKLGEYLTDSPREFFRAMTLPRAIVGEFPPAYTPTRVGSALIVGEDWQSYKNEADFDARASFGWGGATTLNVRDYIALVPDTTFKQVAKIIQPENCSPRASNWEPHRITQEHSHRRRTKSGTALQ
jgi:hypothetical protein